MTKINVIDEIIVNTDSELALEIADEYGVGKFKRDPYFATSECNNSEFFQNMAQTTETDYLIYSPCTAPLVKEVTYYDFINRFRSYFIDICFSITISIPHISTVFTTYGVGETYNSEN